ncbi:xanthine dehydrogenase family protein subunit M [bacterium]|nr:xanthine dehydrogenase family protein subunit M [bacterium]
MKYYCPKTLAEYFDLSKSIAAFDVSVIAGGTDLVPRYERGDHLPDYLIDLKHLSEINSIEVDDDSIKIGSLSTIQNIQDHSLIQEEFGALHSAAYDFAGAQIRHRGTIGGNICNASPAGDLLPPLYAFEAMLTLQGPAGERQIPIGEFILGPGATDLRVSELLTGVTLVRKGYQSLFQKVGLRQSMAISVLNLACVFEGKHQAPTHLRITAGAVAPTVVSLDAFCEAYKAAPGKLSELLGLIDEAISPIDDIRATANYRHTVLKNLIKEILKN